VAMTIAAKVDPKRPPGFALKGASDLKLGMLTQNLPPQIRDDRGRR